MCSSLKAPAQTRHCELGAPDPDLEPNRKDGGPQHCPLWHCRQAGPFRAELGPRVTSLSHSVDDISLHAQASVFCLFFCTFKATVGELIEKVEVGFRVTRSSWQ